MFDEFIRRRKEKRAIRNWQSSALGKTLTNHTHEYFTRYPRLSNFSEVSKSKIVTDFYQVIFSFQQNENPLLAMRERLAAYVIAFSTFQVISLTEDEKAEQLYSNCPYISGQLHRHIEKVAEHEEELRELKWKNPSITAVELIEFCNIRRLLYLYYVNGINHVRYALDDFDKQKDWLQPFVKAMAIWQEDSLRQKVGLPSLLPNALDSLRYSSFWSMVENGEKNPYYKWEMEWPDLRDA